MAESKEFSNVKIISNYIEHRLPYDETVPKAIVDFLSGHIRGRKEEKPYFDIMLDAGCGFGKSTLLFSPYFHSITGFDISEKMIEKANELNDADNIRYVVGRGENMPAIDESVDLIFCSFSIHFMNLDKFIAECIRVLKPDGCVAIIGPQVSNIICCTEYSQTDHNVSAMDLWNSYDKSLYAFSRSISHPQQYVADHYKPIYDKITAMNKVRKTGLEFPCFLTLKDLTSSFLSIPCFQMKESEPGLENESMKMFAEKLKNLWNISHLEDQDVKLEVVHSADIIFLTKKE